MDFKFLCLGLFLYSLNCSANQSDFISAQGWAEKLKEKEEQINQSEVSKVISNFQEGVTDSLWLREQIKKITDSQLNQENLLKENIEPKQKKRKCKNCVNEGLINVIEEPNFKIFMSFSVPESIWKDLSKDLNKMGGTFVLRGIPENSFSKLAWRIFELKNRGVDAQIEIDPLAFKKYEITQVPSFVLVNGDKYDKISGTISVDYALQSLLKNGENFVSQSLLERLAK